MYPFLGDGQNNGNTRQYRNKTVFVGLTERTLVVSVFHYSFICLRCLVAVSMHYRLCLVTVCVKVLQNGGHVRFSKWTDSWCLFSCNICNQTATSLSVSRAAVAKVMMTYTNHRKTSAERNSGQQPKQGERDRHTLKKTVNKNHRTAAAKVTAELSAHPEDSPTRASQIQHPT